MQILIMKEQFIHCRVGYASGSFEAYLTVVYAKNEEHNRLALWSELIQLGRTIQVSWLLIGDFNAMLSSKNRIGSPVMHTETHDFQECVDELQLTTLRPKGWYYTLCNKQIQEARLYSKIDWAFGNYQWLQTYGQVEDEFLNLDFRPFTYPH